MTDVDTKSEEIGRENGRRAAEEFKMAAADGRDLNSIVAFWPKDPEAMRMSARSMIADNDPLWRRIGRQYLAYVDAFEQTWPEHRNFA
ncbi:hypothetical protein [Bradyrhizobium sp. USDA 10063]